MSFHDVRFPTDIAYGSRGGPEFSTDIVSLVSGHEQRNSNWAEARARYNVAHGVKTAEQLQTLLAFFRARKGRAHSFRFKDWTDYAATGEAIGTGDGSNTTYSLLRTYASGSNSITRTITHPIGVSVVVYVGGVQQTLTTDYALDSSTGIITFVSAPTSDALITADYEFDVPVRFDTDQLSASLDAYGTYSWLDIPLIEVRV